MYRYELHAHTSECDRDAALSAKELVCLYKDAGYDGIVITDHYIERFYTLWFPEEVTGLTHHQQVYRWLKGYRTAKEIGNTLDFTVLPGAEVRFDGKPNDYLLYGLNDDFFYTVPRLNELGSLETLISLLPKDTCVVHAHPFRNGMTVTEPSGLFGIETYNGGTSPIGNQLAKLFAEHYKLPATSGSDIHDLNRLAKGGILTDRRIQTPEDLTTVLRSREYELITSAE